MRSNAPASARQAFERVTPRDEFVEADRRRTGGRPSARRSRRRARTASSSPCGARQRFLENIGREAGRLSTECRFCCHPETQLPGNRPISARTATDRLPESCPRAWPPSVETGDGSGASFLREHLAKIKPL